MYVCSTLYYYTYIHCAKHTDSLTLVFTMGAQAKSMIFVAIAIGFAFYQLSKTYSKSSERHKYAKLEVSRKKKKRRLRVRKGDWDYRGTYRSRKVWDVLYYFDGEANEWSGS